MKLQTRSADRFHRCWISLQNGVVYTVQMDRQGTLQKLTLRQSTARASDVFNADASSFVQV